VPSFLSGTFSVIIAITLSGIVAIISVAINPGATVFTVILYFPYSLAHVFVKPITPAFVAA
jgi:hypothetical protein